MDPKQFNELVKPLMRWSKKTSTWMVKPQVKTCEYCLNKVVNPRVYCRGYQLGTPEAHLKHKCVCRQLIYDGSIKKNPWLMKPQISTNKAPINPAKNDLTK